VPKSNDSENKKTEEEVTEMQNDKEINDHTVTTTQEDEKGIALDFCVLFHEHSLKCQLEFTEEKTKKNDEEEEETEEEETVKPETEDTEAKNGSLLLQYNHYPQ